MHVTEWTPRCNLRLNKNKTQEKIIKHRRGDMGPRAGEVISMVILGSPCSEFHIIRIYNQARQSLYTLSKW